MIELMAVHLGPQAGLPQRFNAVLRWHGRRAFALRIGVGLLLLLLAHAPPLRAQTLGPPQPPSAEAFPERVVPREQWPARLFVPTNEYRIQGRDPHRYFEFEFLPKMTPGFVSLSTMNNDDDTLEIDTIRLREEIQLVQVGPFSFQIRAYALPAESIVARHFDSIKTIDFVLNSSWLSSIKNAFAARNPHLFDGPTSSQSQARPSVHDADPDTSHVLVLNEDTGFLALAAYMGSMNASGRNVVVAVHGSQKSVSVSDPQGQKKGIKIKDLAARIRHHLATIDSTEKTDMVELYTDACELGRRPPGDRKGAAQKLVNALGRHYRVTALTGYRAYKTAPIADIPRGEHVNAVPGVAI